MTEPIITLRYVGKKRKEDGAEVVRTITEPTLNGVAPLAGVTIGQLKALDLTTIGEAAQVVRHTAIRVDDVIQGRTKVETTDQEIGKCRPNAGSGWYGVNTASKRSRGEKVTGEYYEYLYHDISLGRSERERKSMGELLDACEELRDAVQALPQDGRHVSLVGLSVALKPTPYQPSDKQAVATRRAEVLAIIDAEIARAALAGETPLIPTIKELTEQLNAQNGRRVNMGTVITDLKYLQGQGEIELRAGSRIVRKQQEPVYT